MFQNWASGNHLNPECGPCSKRMLLVGQIYAPLDNSANHRTLYQFCCVNHDCYGKVGSWVCLRDEIKDSISSVSTVPTATTRVTDTFWNDDADDWGDEEEPSIPIESLSVNDSNSTDLNNLKTENIPSAELEIETTHEANVVSEPPTKPSEDIRSLLNPTVRSIPESAITEFSSFYLNVTEEQLSVNQKLDLRANELLKEYQRKENCDLKQIQSRTAAKPNGTEGEDYEKSLPSHGDELVHKFISKAQACPEQLIRYNRGGSPLLLQPLPTQCIPNCRYCGSKLVFEMQLMPHLSQRLTLTDFEQDGGSLTEFGTVIVFACSESCWNAKDSVREEYLVVQTETF